MLKTTFMFLVTGIFILGISKISFAMSCHDADAGHSQHQAVAQAQSAQITELDAVKEAQPKEAVNAGNKICPVTGDKIDDKYKVTVEYEGKIYNLCCEACVGEFKNNPRKYIKKIEEEIQSSPKKKDINEKSIVDPDESGS